jgi:hypothetical protein
VDGDVAIARGDEGDGRAEEPEDWLDDAHELHGKSVAALAEDEGHGRGYGDADDIGLAHEAVEREMALAEARGELEGAEGGGQDAGDGVGDQEETVEDELLGVGVVGVNDDGVVGVVEDRDAGEAKRVPEEVLGKLAGGAGASEGGGGSRHGL